MLNYAELSKRRVPRKTKKAINKLIAGTPWTPMERRRLGRCLFLRGGKPRKVGSHVAMGDTSRINAMIHIERERVQTDKMYERDMRRGR